MVDHLNTSQQMTISLLGQSLKGCTSLKRVCLEKTDLELLQVLFGVRLRFSSSTVDAGLKGDGLKFLVLFFFWNDVRVLKFENSSRA
ncbi:hypothetical protein V6Z12_D06G043000 [Gossypium hirsutum]